MARQKNKPAERERKRKLWLERTMRLTGWDRQKVEQTLSIKRQQSFRLNPLKPLNKTESPLLLQGPTLQYRGRTEVLQGGTLQHGVGYFCDAEMLERVKDSSLVADGKVYVQNAASWLPVLALSPRPDENILDVCAAPGGKASHIQALTNNQSTLTCNDNSKPRLIKLQANMQRLGAEATYMLSDATRLSQQLPAESFDKILLDVPCSGEGLMTLDDLKLFDSWSVAHIRRLGALQKNILTTAWQLLKPGGTLVYSTCTMAPEENEAVIDYFLRKHPDAKLEPVSFDLDNRLPALLSWNDKPFQNDLSPCLRLMPSTFYEAFFVAKLVKK